MLTATALGAMVLLDRETRTAAVSTETAGRTQRPDVARHAALGAGRPPLEELPSLGIQYHGTWTHYTSRERARVLDAIERSGATWVRLDVGWAMLQPKAGRYDEQGGVAAVDEVMEELRRRGLKVLVMFWLTPEWATAETDPALAQYTSPDDPGDYARALGWAADRWGDVVDAWEIWNEPNLDVFYVGTDPVTYAELLCRSFPVLRREDPSAKVVFGGLMYHDDAWLEAAYDAGAGGCFDVLAVHSYQAPADAPPSMSDAGDVWNLLHLDEVRRTMLRHGDRLPVWVTEFGWSIHEDEPGTEKWRRGVNEQQQAEYAGRALRMMAREFPYVTAAFWYKDSVNETSTDEHQEGYGMLDADLQPRAVLDTFRWLYRQG